jgi:hypothetical protein
MNPSKRRGAENVKTSDVVGIFPNDASVIRLERRTRPSRLVRSGLVGAADDAGARRRLRLSSRQRLSWRTARRSYRAPSGQRVPP